MLGSSSVHPLDMANAYATFAAQGVHHDVHIVSQVLNPDGSVNYQTDGDPERKFEQDVMADATYAMTQVVQKGSGKPYIAPLGVPIAGKTGTSTGNISAWFVGYTPTISTAVALSQVGDDGSSEVTIKPFGPSPYGGPLGEVTGGSIPARLWAEYMGPVLDMEQFAKQRDFRRARTSATSRPRHPRPPRRPRRRRSRPRSRRSTRPSRSRAGSRARRRRTPRPRCSPWVSSR